MINRLLRWLFGYIDFRLEGKYPERFINISCRRGINTWKMEGKNNSFSARVKTNHLAEAKTAAEKSGNVLIVEKEHGLPFLIRQYKNRCGLLIGAVLFCIISCLLSGFVWCIDCHVPESINEFEIRTILREHGLYEGASLNSIELRKLQNQVFMSDKRIGRIYINFSGSRVDVNVSERSIPIHDAQDKNAVSNIISSADGTVTRIEVQNGSGLVKSGEGIRKDQLLVSGTIDYTNGMIKLVDSIAKVYAKTSRSVDIVLPKQYVSLITKSTVQKNQMKLFIVPVPLSLNPDPTGNCYKYNKMFQIQLFGNSVPVYLSEENWYEYQKKPETLERSRAEIILRNKLKLYEIFMVYSSDDAKILKNRISVSEEKECFRIKADYEIEENVAKKSYLEVRDDSVNTEKRHS